MKFYISADIEGIGGVTTWDECSEGKPGYGQSAQRMTEEVATICHQLNKLGAKEIVVKDAHNSALNINHYQLPENVILIRNWAMHPYGMMQELDSSFTGSFLVGYHAPSGSMGSPLAHTMTTKAVTYLNGELFSEFHLSYYISLMERVPVLMLSGDQAICNIVTAFNPQITTVATKRCQGRSTINYHPVKIREMLEKSVTQAVENILPQYQMAELPQEFNLEIRYKNATDSCKASFYAGIERLSDNTLRYKNSNFYEILRLIYFLFM